MVPARAQFRAERKSAELPAKGNSERRLKDTSFSLGDCFIRCCYWFYCLLHPLLENQNGMGSTISVF